MRLSAGLTASFVVMSYTRFRMLYRAYAIICYLLKNVGLTLMLLIPILPMTYRDPCPVETAYQD